MTTKNLRVDEYLDRIDVLPPAPTLIVELLGQFKQPDRDMDKVVELIMHDPALTASLLKLCNSAFFGSSQSIETVFDAVMRVGFYEVYRMVVAVHFGNQTDFLSGAERALSVNEFWKHSVRTAVAAETVAKEVREDEATAFTAGMLHDIGKIILAVAQSEVYARLQKAGPARGQTMMEAEKALLGADHAQVGGRLMERWNLPTHLMTAIKCHHDPGHATPFERLAANIHLANVIAYTLAPACGTAPIEFKNPAKSLEILGLAADNYPTLVTRSRTAVERSKPLMER